MSQNKEFGEKVKELRLTKGMTQEQLANMIGIDITYLSKIENGLMPGDETAKKLIKSLDNGKGELECLYGIKALADFERKVKPTKPYGRIEKSLRVLEKILKESEG